MNILIWLIVVPFVASLLSFILPIHSKRALKWVCTGFSIIPLILLIVGYPQLTEQVVKYDWFPPLHIEFFLKVDTLALVFLFLTSIIIPITLIASESSHVLFGLIFLLQALLNGFFSSRDLFLFIFFWEAMLLPIYFIISLWGNKERFQTAFTFIIYMIAGSALMVAAALSLYFTSQNTFDMDQLSSNTAWVFAIFLLAFAVKTPLFPFHAWLPDVYTNSSTTGTILLSALLSKAGIYGFLRISLEIFPTQMQLWSPYLLWLAIVGTLYGGLSAWVQTDFKRLIAYSSFSHVNFIIAGIFIWHETAQTGAVIQAFNHGITITALFLVIAWLEKRLGHRTIGKEKGLAQYMPILCWLTLFFVLSSVALPATNNFVGELLILFGIFKSYPWQAAILSLSVVISVMYMLRFMQKVYFETPSPYNENWKDLTKKEILLSLPLIALVLWIGIYPAPILEEIQKSTISLVEKK